MLCYMGGSTKPAREAGKALALRRALLALQKEYGPTGRKFAQQAGVQSGTWSRYMTGQQKPSEQMINKICDNLDVNGERRANLLSYLHDTDVQQWVALTLPEQQAMFAFYLDREDASHDISEANALIVPGLAQTRAYAEEIMKSGEAIRDVPRNERSTRVNARVGRRDILTRANPVNFHAFIGEAVLNQVVGSRALMADQFRYLLHLAKQPNVEIRIIPFSGSGFHPALEGSIVRLNTEEGAFFHVEFHGTSMMLNAKPDIDRFKNRLDAIEAVALKEDASLRMIAEYAERMERAA